MGGGPTPPKTAGASVASAHTYAGDPNHANAPTNAAESTAADDWASDSDEDDSDSSDDESKTQKGRKKNKNHDNNQNNNGNGNHGGGGNGNDHHAEEPTRAQKARVQKFAQGKVMLKGLRLPTERDLQNIIRVFSAWAAQVAGFMKVLDMKISDIVAKDYAAIRKQWWPKCRALAKFFWVVNSGIMMAYASGEDPLKKAFSEKQILNGMKGGAHTKVFTVTFDKAIHQIAPKNAGTVLVMARFKNKGPTGVPDPPAAPANGAAGHGAAGHGAAGSGGPGHGAAGHGGPGNGGPPAQAPPAKGHGDPKAPPTHKRNNSAPSGSAAHYPSLSNYVFPPRQATQQGSQAGGGGASRAGGSQTHAKASSKTGSH